MFTHFTVTPRYIDQNAQLFLENNTTHRDVGVCTAHLTGNINHGILPHSTWHATSGERGPCWTLRGPSVDLTWPHRQWQQQPRATNGRSLI